ncbi:MAG TPA: hypothetical protein VF753_06420 [Terriglobales bacterium]
MILVVPAVVLLVLPFLLLWLIGHQPYPTRMYLALSSGAAVSVLTGMFFLVSLIPFASKVLKSELRTELYSVRASYLCVIAGLVMLAVVTIGLVAAQLIQTLRRP